jgi:DNA mismatch repair protein MSH5
MYCCYSRHLQALKRLETLMVDGKPHGLHAHEHLAVLNTLIDLTREQQASALGALLMIMQKVGVGASIKTIDSYLDPVYHVNIILCLHVHVQEGNAAGQHVEVHRLTEIQLQGCLMIDPGTLAGLQIMQEERHASQMGIGKSREGFSVFGIMQRCVTQMASSAAPSAMPACRH